MKHEIFINNSRALTVSIAASKVESLKTNINSETSYRVYKDGFIGVAGQMGKCNLDELREKAIEKLAARIPYPQELTGGQLNINSRKQLIEEADFVRMVERILSKLNQEFPDFVFSNSVVLNEISQSYTNSEGAQYSYLANSLVFVILIKQKNSPNSFDGAIIAEQNYLDEEALLEDARHQLTAFKNKVALPKEPLPIIINDTIISFAAMDLVAEKFGSGAGIFAKKLGQKIFNENLNLIINRVPENVQTLAFFDAEGTVLPAFKHHLIKNGVLCGALTNKRSAAQFNLELSGTASCAFDSVPTISFGGLEIAPTHNNAGELVDRAIVVSMTSGGDMTPSGDLGLPVQLAYLYENGKLVGRLPELMISGNLFDVLGKDYIGTVESAWEKYCKSNLNIVRMNVVQK